MCDKYGRLYNWATAMGGSASSAENPSGVQGVCPAGWHLPSDAEWTALTDFFDKAPQEKFTDLATRMKADSPLWFNYDKLKGRDDFGFSALPGGVGRPDDYFLNFSATGLWWSTTEKDASNAYERYISYMNTHVTRRFSDKGFLYSVRCLKD